MTCQKQFIALALLVWGLLLPASPAWSAGKKGRPASNGETVDPLRPTLPGALPAEPRAPLPPSKLPLEFVKRERVALVGGSLAERFNLFGNFETMLHFRLPDKELVVRNFARPADEVALRQRPGDYTKLDDPLTAFEPDTLICFFGFNESFAGPAGVESFTSNYEKYLDEMAQRYPRGAAGAPRFVLVTPIAFEGPRERSANDANAHDGGQAPKQILPLAPDLLPDGVQANANLKLYAAAVEQVAKKRSLAVVDLHAPTDALFSREPGLQFTINGCHLNEEGDRQTALLLAAAITGQQAETLLPLPQNAAWFERLRTAVNDKSWVHCQDYRMLNGWYVYGGRRTWDTETFPREFIKIRNMAAVRDRRVWDIAQGNTVASTPDDSQTGELIVPNTRFGLVGKSEAESPRVLSPEAELTTFTMPEGFEARLFASEKQFPQLIKPCQIGFDNRGRLWASCMPTYPQWLPGDGRPSDRLLIFEDTDHDGRADVCKTFYDKLHCPTGFEFWQGGVLVVDQPRLLWLKDTDGDDRADLVVHLLDGWATDDTHHTIGAFEWSHGGLLHMMEGVAMSTAVETPWGPRRNLGSSGVYRLDPRTLRITHFNTPGYGNPWCYVFNPWGQGFCGDGTSGNQHWDSPLSGAQFRGRRGLNAVFNNEGMRPVVGSEFLYSRHFPESVQGQFIYACVINMNGLTRFTVDDDGAGFKGARLKHTVDGSATPDDLLASADKHFRPVDPQIGPDGALWFGDWANPLIGHMQYSQRDPNRDHSHGRIYRLCYKNKPLLTPAPQHGKSVQELLDQLREPEPRARYRARIELRARPTADVLAALKTWTANVEQDRAASSESETDRLLTEALWIEQCHHAIDESLLERVLNAKTSDARAAAVRVVADQIEFAEPSAQPPGSTAPSPGSTATGSTAPGSPSPGSTAAARSARRLGYLAAAVADAHPRVRLEAVRALSFVPTLEAIAIAHRVTARPMDYWLNYTLAQAVGALEPVWQAALKSGQLAKIDPAAAKYVAAYGLASAPGAKAQAALDTLMSRKSKSKDKQAAVDAFEKMKGNAETGKAVFSRTCLNCHKVGHEGFEYGPALTDVSKRLKFPDVVESIIEPNAKVDPKFQTTVIVTDDGKVHTGLLAGETDKIVTLKIAAVGKAVQTVEIEKSAIDDRQTLKQSSMPEGLPNSLSPLDFLDLLEFLKTLK